MREVRQGDYEFEAYIGYVGRTYIKTPKTKRVNSQEISLLSYTKGTYVIL